MNPQILAALQNSDPFDLIWALEGCIDVDREHLSREPNAGHQLVAVAAMFATVFGASGYAGVLNELRPNLALVGDMLRNLQIPVIADEMRRILALAASLSLTMDSDEDDWDEFIEKNGDFRQETQRDVPRAAALIADSLRQYITSHPSFF